MFIILNGTETLFHETSLLLAKKKLELYARYVLWSKHGVAEPKIFSYRYSLDEFLHGAIVARFADERHLSVEILEVATGWVSANTATVKALYEARKVETFETAMEATGSENDENCPKSFFFFAAQAKNGSNNNNNNHCEDGDRLAARDAIAAAAASAYSGSKRIGEGRSCTAGQSQAAFEENPQVMQRLAEELAVKVRDLSWLKKVGVTNL